MNWATLEGNWRQLKGAAKVAWGKLTDADLTQIAGKRDVFLGKIEERYGLARDEAERRLDRWLDTLDGQDSIGADTGRTKSTH